VSGHAYIAGTVQQPGAEESSLPYGKNHPEICFELRRLIDERGILGYFGGLPAIRR
jgi:hypothetical protein